MVISKGMCLGRTKQTQCWVQNGGETSVDQKPSAYLLAAQEHDASRRVSVQQGVWALAAVA